MQISFNADGSYMAYGYDGTSPAYPSEADPPAFYYGEVDICPSLDRWRLLRTDGDGSISGEIDVPFYYGSGLCQLPAWQGELSSLTFDASGNRLRFSFNRSDGDDPVVYDLWRECVQ